MPLDYSSLSDAELRRLAARSDGTAWNELFRSYQQDLDDVIKQALKLDRPEPLWVRALEEHGLRAPNDAYPLLVEYLSKNKARILTSPPSTE